MEGGEGGRRESFVDCGDIPSDEECRAQFETNFFGPLTLCRHIIPSMRARRSGLIINISSTAGIEAKASRTMYSGSKFALEAFSESLYHEMKPFNVRVLLVEPGAFRSSFSDKISIGGGELPKEYEATITGQMLAAVKNLQGGNSLVSRLACNIRESNGGSRLMSVGRC